MGPHSINFNCVRTGFRSPLTSRRKVIAIGDVHGELGGLIKNLKQAKVIDGACRWIGQETTFIQTGDMIDRGSYSREAWAFMGSLQKKAKAEGGDVIRLLGNHELMLMQGEHKYVNFNDPEEMAGEIRQDVLNGRVKAAHVTHGRLFTHAGLMPEIRQRIINEIVRQKQAEAGAISWGNSIEITLEEIAQRLNDLLMKAVSRNNFSHPIFQIGASRLTDKAAAPEVGGIFWNDFNDLARFENFIEIEQVVAHTPPRINGIGIRGTNSLNVINLDAGLCEVYGGNHAYLAFDLDGAMKAFLMIEQGWIETPIALSEWVKWTMPVRNNLSGYAY